MSKWDRYGARGDIHVPLAMAQGKMLQSKGWANILPRNITPSDVDLFFDNRGSIIYCEFSSQTWEWQELDTGQLWAYQNHIRGGRNIAVLCYHQVPMDKVIDTCDDIDIFSVMFLHDGCLYYRTIRGNDRWKCFVKMWYSHGYHYIVRQLLKDALFEEEVARQFTLEDEIERLKSSFTKEELQKIASRLVIDTGAFVMMGRTFVDGVLPFEELEQAKN